MSESPRKAVQLFWNFLVVGAANYGAMGLALLINAVLARRLGTEQFGRLALLLLTSQVVSLLVANWTHTALIRFGAREFGSVGSVAEAFWTRVWILVPCVLVAAVTMIAFGDRLARYLTVPRWGILVVLSHFLASLALSTVGAVFQAKEDMHRYGAALFLDKAVMAALVFLLPLSWVGDPLLVLGLYAISSTAVAIWGGISLGKDTLAPMVFSRSAYRSMLSFSLPLILSSWAGLFGTTWFDFIVIRWYRPLSELGLYSLGTVLAGAVQQIAIVFSTLLLPEISLMVANGDLEKIRTFVERVLPYWLLGSSILFTLVALFAEALVPLVFGRAFEQSGSILVLLMLATCAFAVCSAFSPLVSAFGSTWVLTGIYVATGAVNVLMDLLLVPKFGIGGAAVATVLAYGTSAALLMTFVKVRIEGSVFSLGLFALPVAVVYLCFLTLDGISFYLLAIPAVGLAAYWLVRHFRLFSGEDAGFLKDIRFMGAMAPQRSAP